MAFPSPPQHPSSSHHEQYSYHLLLHHSGFLAVGSYVWPIFPSSLTLAPHFFYFTNFLLTIFVLQCSDYFTCHFAAQPRFTFSPFAWLPTPKFPLLCLTTASFKCLPTLTVCRSHQPPSMWLQALPGMLLPDCSFSIDLGWFQLRAGVKKNHLVFAHPMKKLAQKIAVLLSSSDGVGSLQPAPNVAHSTRFFLNMIRGTNTQRCQADRCGSQSVRR